MILPFKFTVHCWLWQRLMVLWIKQESTRRDNYKTHLTLS